MPCFFLFLFSLNLSISIYKNYEDTDDRAKHPTNMNINNSIINTKAQSNFYINSIDNTVFNAKYGSSYYSDYLSSWRYKNFPRIKTITNSILNKVNSSGEPDTTTNAIVYANSIKNSILNGAKFLVGGSVSNSTITSGYIKAATIVENCNFTNSKIENWRNTKIKDSNLSNTNIKITGDSSRLMELSKIVGDAEAKVEKLFEDFEEVSSELEEINADYDEKMENL